MIPSLISKCNQGPNKGKPGPCPTNISQSSSKPTTTISNPKPQSPSVESWFGKPYKGPRNERGIAVGNNPEAAGVRNAESTSRLARRLGFSEDMTRQLGDWAYRVASEEYNKYKYDPAIAEQMVSVRIVKIRQQIEERASRKSLISAITKFLIRKKVVQKDQSHAGEPCQRGWSTARTGCISRSKNPKSREEKPKRERPRTEDTLNNLKEVISQGKISPKAALELGKELLSHTVVDLKQMLGAVGLRKSGNKSNLASRLLDKAIESIREGKEEPKEEPKNEREPSERESSDDTEGRGDRSEESTERDRGDGSDGDNSSETSPKLERETERSGNEDSDRERSTRSESASEETPGDVPRPEPESEESGIKDNLSPKQLASINQVNKKLDRFERLFRSKGQHETANWMGMLKNHIGSVGVQNALESLGAEKEGQGIQGQTQYEGRAEDMSFFCEKYLDRVGITMVPMIGDPSLIDPKQRVISSQSDKFNQQVRPDPYITGDFAPKDPTFVDKLEESKHLPGLESSEDISKIIGKQVTNLTPDVVSKMDEKYGKGQWIIKAYGDEAFAGFGIYFPQRVAEIQRNAQQMIWDAGSHLDQYGFKLARDPETDRVVGLKHHNGDTYQFGTDKYNNTINSDARYWADKAAGAADNEKGPALPGEGKDFMAQPAFPVVGISDAERAAGKTIGSGEGRVHIITRNGKAELVPHSTWIKGESLPVVFEDKGTLAMAQAAVEAINALPESERQGQIYAPDIVWTADGPRVVEANPANATGSSGYLGDNPFIIDAYVSQLTNKEPTHVKFIRQLLTTKQKHKSLTYSVYKRIPPSGRKILISSITKKMRAKYV